MKYPSFLAIVLLLSVFATNILAAELPGQMSHLCKLPKNPIEDTDSRFVGYYDGYWGEEVGKKRIPMTIIIFKVNNKTVSTYYAYGAYPEWGIEKGECFSVSGNLDGNKITLDQFPESKAKVVYTFTPGEPAVMGTYTTEGYVSYGEFHRVK